MSPFILTENEKAIQVPDFVGAFLNSFHGERDCRIEKNKADFAKKNAEFSLSVFSVYFQ